MKIGMIMPYTISIVPSSNMGFIVEVGCAKFVAKDVDDLLEGLREYFKDTKKMEEAYSQKVPRIVPVGGIQQEPPNPPFTVVT